MEQTLKPQSQPLITEESRSRRRASIKGRIYPLWFAAGALLLYIIFIVVPGLMGFYYSFTDWSSYSREINWVGWDNFRTIFAGNQNYLTYISNTLVFTVLTIALKTVFGLGLAVILNDAITRGTYLHRVILYLPAVLPMLVVGIIFRSILHPATGLLNTGLRAIGLDVLAQQWLVNPDIALFSVIGVDTWKGVGYIMVILLAGMQAIPRDYYEAAEMDGASGWAKLLRITIPLLMPAIAVTTVLNLLHGLKVFDIVYVLTNGGPGYATEVVFTSVFKEFSKGRYGLSTALSTLLFLIMVVIGYFTIRLMTREERSEQQ